MSVGKKNVPHCLYWNLYTMIYILFKCFCGRSLSSSPVNGRSFVARNYQSRDRPFVKNLGFGACLVS
jgi:hypothetical protein